MTLEQIPEFKLDNLKADCEKCSGLCCVALYFSKQDGFPMNKSAGESCINLNYDFSCKVHKNLQSMGLRGCMGFDCLGAGQQVTQYTYKQYDWKAFPTRAAQIFDAFLIMRQLHELLWYLAEAWMIEKAEDIRKRIQEIAKKTKDYTLLCEEQFLTINIETHWDAVQVVLSDVSARYRDYKNEKWKASFIGKKTLGNKLDLFGKDLRNINLCRANLRGACLIAADLRGLELNKTDMIGADMRDSDIRGTDLSKCIFLTQSQVNVAKGDKNTKLPEQLRIPEHWRTYR